MYKLNHLLVVLFLGCFSCGDGNTDTPTLPTNEAEVSISETSQIEGNANSTMEFVVRTRTAVEAEVIVSYELKGITAEPNVDFTSTEKQVVIPIGSNSATISIAIIDDEIKEVDEKLSITLTDATNAKITNALAVGLIRDNDAPIYTEDGYSTPTSHYGYELEWSDEFSGDALNTDFYNYDLGDGCPNLCGWGNRELQVYTDQSENISLENGKLIIRASKEGINNYTSTKIHTKDKQLFQFGRIDVRAKLPEGQGIWPAIWMLGQNIDAVGWPACGEIDIMELVGHEPETTHATVHWGPQGGPNKYLTKSYPIDEKFSERFHVFSLVWEFNELVWYLDEIPIHSFSPSGTQGELYPFNQTFYMIFNVAIGGNWPGNPDATTVFPQQMEIDYVRYFK